MKGIDRDINLIVESGLFDDQWYLNEYPDVAELGLDPITHYLRIGVRLGRNPGPSFDASWYLKTYEDVAAAGLNPLQHYLMHGRFEGREIRAVGEIAGLSEGAIDESNEGAACLTVLPAKGGALPDLFGLKSRPAKSRTVIVTYSDSVSGMARVNDFLQSQDEEFDHIAICPISIPVKSRESQAARCKQKITVIYSDRYGPACSFVHLVNSDFLCQYDVVCWLRCFGEGDSKLPGSQPGATLAVRDGAGVAVVSEQVLENGEWMSAEVKRLLGIFLPRIGRRDSAISGDVKVPTGDALWINPLLIRQLRAIPVRPDELLDKTDKRGEVGCTVVKALLGIISREGGFALLDLGQAKEHTQLRKRNRAKAPREVKAIAFYLPQYHPIPENDQWWGKGFTEWNNVVRAKPLFRGHSQPRVPADLGYYDLRLPDTQEAQAALALKHGIHGFCYYYYWFNGRKLLNSPIEKMLKSGKPSMQFCVCWANENWSRNWDGQNRHVLLEQRYSMESNRAFIREMIPMMKDSRYIRHHGKPVLVVYRIRVIPDWQETADMWREECRQAGLGEIHLCAVRFGLEPLDGPPGKFGVDAYVLFPPHETVRVDVRGEQIDLDKAFRGELFSYDAVVEGDISRFADGYPWPVHRGAMMGWDNTARRMTDSRIFVGATPVRFRYWLKNILIQEEKFNQDDESLLFINAWNEWAEGTYLEPDQRNGTGYLSAVNSALAEFDLAPMVKSVPTPQVTMPPVDMHPVLPALMQPSNTKRGVPILPTWHKGERGLLTGAPHVLLCAHISGHQLFGGERSFLDVLDAMCRMNLNVIVTLPSGNNRDYVNEVRKRSIGVYVFSYPQWLKDRAVDESLVLTFADIIVRHSIDIVHANTIVLQEPLVAARRMKRIALVHSRELITLDESLRDRIGLPSQEIVRQVFGLSDYVIANSRATAGVFRREGKTFYVPNAVRPDALDLPNIVSEKVKFAIVSSNIPKKGVADFIEVAKLCSVEIDNAEFVVVGPENKQIEAWRDEQRRGKVPDNIKFVGYRETPQQAMAEANVILNLSSFAESFGRTVAEALMARRPVIAYEWGALPELIEHGDNGYLAPYRDVATVANYVLKLCRDPELIKAMGEHGRAAMLANFTSDNLYENLVAAYQSIFGGALNCDVLTAVEAAEESSACASAPGLTIVVPVFNACEEVRACLDSVIRNTNLARIRLLVINDGSSDRRVGELLTTYHGVQGVEIRDNERNLGYTKTINIGIREAGDDDVVLLNSDTIVTPQWIEGLRSTAYCGELVGTVTAMSDNAGAFSFPVQGRENPKPAHVSNDDYAASIVQATARCNSVEVPTGSGFCMYIRRKLLDEIGVFDEVAFPRGYGEENDFCMRAVQAGWKNVITPHAFVFHVRTASFGAEKPQLVQSGVDVVTKRYPEYAKLTKAAFSSQSMLELRNTVAEAVSLMAKCD